MKNDNDEHTKTSKAITQIAEMMGRVGFATGHGSSIAGLLNEMEWQINELRKLLTDNFGE